MIETTVRLFSLQTIIRAWDMGLTYNKPIQQLTAEVTPSSLIAINPSPTAINLAQRQGRKECTIGREAAFACLHGGLKIPLGTEEMCMPTLPQHRYVNVKPPSKITDHIPA